MNISHQRVITADRACVRLIETADALLDYRPAWTEALLSRRLRGLVRALPAEMGAEILAAGEKIEGPVQEFGRNQRRGKERDNDNLLAYLESCELGLVVFARKH